MRLKIRRVLPIVVLVLVLMIGNILAYFTDMDTATNEFTTGRISIDLQEPNWDSGQGGELVPGYEIPKDPQVLNDGINDAFVFITVEVPYQNVTTTDEEGNKLQPADTELFSYDVKDGWVQVGEPDIDTENNIIKYVYAYSKDGELTPLKPGDTTITIFDFIQFEDVIEDEGLEDTKLDVVVKAYGIQTDNLDGGKTSPEDVWPIVDKSEINEYDTDIALEDIVIDYGLPVTIEASKLGDEPVVEELSYATHGTVEIDGDSSKGNFTVTYTLTEMLSEMDTVHLVTESGEEYTFNVIPATTMYYEEDFVTLYTLMKEDSGIITTPGGWDIISNGGKKNQQVDRPGYNQINASYDANNVYGSDKAYNNCSNASMGSSVKIHVGNGKSGTAEFEFYGTGFDIISTTSHRTGTIIIRVTDPANKTKNYVLDTYYGYQYQEDLKEDYNNDGKLDDNDRWILIDSNQKEKDNSIWQVPIFKLEDLEYGKYKVEITISYAPFFNHDQYDDSTYDFYLDGIRIYNPANNGDDNEIIKNAYLLDNEAYPEYFEVRNKLLEQGSFDKDSFENPGIVYIDGSDVEDISEYMHHGPNNELYLSNGQKVAFRLENTNADNIAAVHIGAKTAFGNEVKIKVHEYGSSGKTITTKTATDMYYDITDYITWDDGETGLIVIECNGEEGAVASITNMKITYKDESAGTTSALITKDDIDKLI